MNRSLVIKRLWWKELQQLWPLVALLVLLGGLLQTIFAVIPGFFDSWRHRAILVALPGLFAVGAGALVVGQEKELRTLQWLRSLPIAASDILSTKLLIGLSGLITVWIASLLIALATGKLPMATNNEIGLMPFVIHSFFILFVGYATAWRMQSSFVGLLLLIPLACLPLLFASLHAWLMNATRDQELNNLLIAVYSVVFASGFLWAGWRIGLKQLGPLEGTRPRVGSLVANVPTDNLFQRRRLAPMPALVWQFAFQNRIQLIGLTLAVALAGFVLGATTGNLRFGNLFVPAQLFAAIACSWLGLLTFQSDGVNRRAMFLADRGIAPWKVWLTRQMLPVSALLVGLAVATASFPSQFDWSEWVVALAFGIYACSQFCAQLTRSPILGTITAVLFSALTIALFIASVLCFFSSPWLVAISLLTFPLATFAMTRSWMDGRTGWWVASRYAGIILFAWLLPLLPFLSFMLTAPRITSGERQQLESLAYAKRISVLGNASKGLVTADRSVRSSTLGPVEMLDPPMESKTSGDADSPVTPESFTTAHWTEQLKLVQGQFAQFQNGLPHQRVSRALVPRMTLIRMRLQQAQAAEEHNDVDQQAAFAATDAPQSHADQSSSTSAELLAGYRITIEVLLETSQRLRSSWRVADQTRADQMEIALLIELKTPQAKENFGAELHKRVCARIADAAVRDAARRSAVAASWKQAQVDASYFIGYDSGNEANQYSRTAWTQWIQQGPMAVALLRLVEAPASERPALRRQAIEQFPPLAEAMSSERLSTNDPSDPQLLYDELMNDRILATWYNGWEQQAEDYVRSLD